MTSKPNNDSAESPSKRQKTASSDGPKLLSGRRESRQAQTAELTRLGVDVSQYNKQQLRRMCKRVARGLNPIETPQERHNRLVKDAELRREEEAELSGMLYEKTIVKQDGDDNNSVVATEVDEQEPVLSSPKQKDEDGSETPCIPTGTGDSNPAKSPPKKQRAKAVPPDYTCFACKNTIQPAHWIYDCPNKQTVRGTNQVSKQKRGLRDPSKSKLFVSGLPFETTIADVKKLVADRVDVPVESCRLLKFPDSTRCKGQAYVSFRTGEEAAKVIKTLNGMKVPEDGKKNRNKELQLRVTHVLNRSLTTKRKLA